MSKILIDYSSKYPYTSKLYSKNEYSVIYITPEQFRTYEFYLRNASVLNNEFDVENEEHIDILRNNFEIVEKYLRKRFNFEISENIDELIEKIEDLDDERAIFAFKDVSKYSSKIRNLNDFHESENLQIDINCKNITSFKDLIEIVEKINNLNRMTHLRFKINNYGYQILCNYDLNKEIRSEDIKGKIPKKLITV